MCNINSPFFNEEDAARVYLEGQRWPDGPICPHCGGVERIYPVKENKQKKVRKGLYQCNDCDQQFTVTVGTVFERSKVPLHKWLMATYLHCSSKKGVSAKQIERALGVTYKTAWFMSHRIREAMREDGPGMLGGSGKIVEVDETYVGGKPRKSTPRRFKTRRPTGRGTVKAPVVALVERKGRVHARTVPSVNKANLKSAIKEHIHKDSQVITDEFNIYKWVGTEYKHDVVTHSIGEYVRGDIHTNTIEGFFSILKRGLNGVYHHCSKDHLSRYLDEFSFRYNYREKLGYDDMTRTNIALKGIEGKRLTYARPNPQ